MDTEKLYSLKIEVKKLGYKFRWFLSISKTTQNLHERKTWKYSWETLVFYVALRKGYM